MCFSPQRHKDNIAPPGAVSENLSAHSRTDEFLESSLLASQEQHTEYKQKILFFSPVMSVQTAVVDCQLSASSPPVLVCTCQLSVVACRCITELETDLIRGATCA